MEQTKPLNRKKANVTKITITGMLAALSAILMFFSINVPLMPSFIKMDFSELPALIASFVAGPLYGVAVCLVKNLINLMFSTTGGVGELSNFILGCLLVLPAGLTYKIKKTRKSAIIGCIVGTILMAVLSVVTNYYIVYPVYTGFMPMEAILNAYQAINPNVSSLWDALIWFNMPFTFIKGSISCIFTLIVYKPLSNAIKSFINK